ncbi:MAG: hypothetical protein L7T19_06290, partial [Pseudomonadales bacterium]|nr:hypothetical protein [Pseudomonadales bacterium]
MPTNTLYTNAKLFTAGDENVTENGTVWVQDDTVVFAGNAAALPSTPQASRQIDLQGKFLMPGMTETHAHLSFADASPFAIGATSVED